MDQVKDCPQCRLVNPPTAQQCDCGYDFTKGRPTRPFMQGAELTTGDWLICLLLPGIGLILGLIRLVSRKPSAGKMLLVSTVATAIWVMFRLTLLAGSR
jgi:hypothetical protein